MEAVDAGVLLELLDNHSDIDATGLSALACASKSFEAAVRVVWPDKEEAYRERKRERDTVRAKALPLPDECMEMYPCVDEVCTYHATFGPRGDLTIEFEWNQELSEWTRHTALMPSEVAKREYFLDTADLKMLQPYRDGKGPWYFKFDDVMGAVMLRHGRKSLADMMAARASRKGGKVEQRGERWRLVWAEVARVGTPEDYLTMSVVHTYARDYVQTKRGGIRGFKKRLWRHRIFSFRVSTRAKTTPVDPLFLTSWERGAVSHLQLAYVLTEKEEFLEDAIRVVRGMRGFVL
jgi:hypothetical protein